MKKLILIFCFSIFITACSTFPNPISKSALDKIEVSFGTSYVLLETWRDQCEARQIPLSCRVQVPKAQAVAKEAQSALIEARDLVDNYPTVDTTIIISKAESLVIKFKNILAQYGRS